MQPGLQLRLYVTLPTFHPLYSITSSHHTNPQTFLLPYLSIYQGSGTEMCNIADCGHDVYRPVNSNPLVVGSSVSCSLASSVKCLALQPSVSPSPSATPSNSPSASATPSVSVTPSNTPTPSVTPSVSPAVIVAKGGACDATSTCITGTTCGCLNTCETIVSLEIKALADDKVVPWICDSKLGPETADHHYTGTWTYNGACSDVYFQVINSLAEYTGVTAAVRETGGTWSGLVLSGAGLTSIVAYDPPSGFMTNPAYDFSAWIVPEQQTHLINSNEYQNFMATYNSDTVTYQDGNLGSSFNKKFYYKVALPYC